MRKRVHGRVFLHLGAPKTGTTYLQNVAWRNAARLADDGVLLPGRGVHQHHAAALRLRDAGFSGPSTEPGSAAWQELADEAHGWRGDVLVSSELLAWATPPQVERALSVWPRHEVHLVVTMRDLVRQLPAVWQEEVKNRRTLDYASFLRQAVEAGPDENGPGGVWGGQDPRQVLGRWAADVPPERVHVVTVPPAGGGSDLLWTRFCEVLGVDGDRYDTTVQQRNTGLGLAEAELLRRVTLLLPDEVGWPSYRRIVKHGLAESEGFAGDGRGKVALPTETWPAVAERSRDIIAYLEEGGFGVTGALTDLEVPATAPPAPAPVEPDPAHVAEAGVRAAAELVERLAEAPRPEPARGRGRRREAHPRGRAGERRARRSRVRRTLRGIVPAPVRSALRIVLRR